jgi:hypothetical protein
VRAGRSVVSLVTVEASNYALHYFPEAAQVKQWVTTFLVSRLHDRGHML